MFTFKKNYFILALALLLLEILIGAFVRDRIIRPYGGDFLVVILLYCTVRAFWNQSPGKVAILVLLFAYAVEIFQYFEIVRHLGLAQNETASVLIGQQFDWLDMLAYTLGVAVCYWGDERWGKC